MYLPSRFVFFSENIVILEREEIMTNIEKTKELIKKAFKENGYSSKTTMNYPN